MQTMMIEERRVFEEKAKDFVYSINPINEPEKAVRMLVSMFEPVQIDINGKTDRSELKELLFQMDKRFDIIDKRFEAVQLEISQLRVDMNHRFEAMDKRFEAMQTQMDKRFEAMQTQIDKRFEAMDKRFEATQIQIDKRFDAVDKRFNTLQWFIGAGFAVISILMPLYIKYLL